MLHGLLWPLTMGRMLWSLTSWLHPLTLRGFWSVNIWEMVLRGYTALPQSCIIQIPGRLLISNRTPAWKLLDCGFASACLVGSISCNTMHPVIVTWSNPFSIQESLLSHGIYPTFGMPLSWHCVLRSISIWHACRLTCWCLALYCWLGPLAIFIVQK